MLIHAPYGGRAGRKGAWKALVESVEEGKVRSIGVSNYGVKHLDEMEEYMKELEEEGGKGKGGMVSVGQWEIHPWLPRKDIVGELYHSLKLEANCFPNLDDQAELIAMSRMVQEAKHRRRSLLTSRSWPEIR